MKQISSLFNFTKTKAKTPEGELIDYFVEEINKEREANNWRYKKGDKWIKQKPISFMGVKMKLYAIKNNQHALEVFLSECRDYKNRNGSFSKRFFGGLSDNNK